MTTLIVIRHGESAANNKERFAGRWNVPLTDMGRRQAKLASEYLKDYDIDRVYSSDLDRAYETAQIIAEEHGINVEKDIGIREIDGGKWEQMMYADIRKTYPDEYGVWMNDLGNAVCVDGESVIDMAARVEKTIHRIVEENDGKTVVVVCHGTPIRALSCIWRGVDIHDMQTVDWVANASISVVEYENADKSPEIVMYGYTEHLADCVTVLPKTV